VALETFNYLDSLVPANPPVGDGVVQGDDHIRGLKLALKNTFPGINAAAARAIGASFGLIIGDGSASAPAYSFASEPGIGFYRQSPGFLGFTGTLRGLGAVPAGAIMDFGGTVAPNGWLVCDGQAVSRATYADLFTAISTTWGVGDGSTTFNVPGLISRYRRHRDAGTGLPVLAGAVGNAQSPANLTHTHGVSGTTGYQNANHTHPGSGSTGAMSANASHTHNSWIAGGAHSGGGGAFGWDTAQASQVPTSATNTDHTHAFSFTTGIENANHGHAFSTTSDAQGDANEARPYSATVLTCIKV